MQKAFKDAIDKAKSESNPDIKVIATQLITYWEQGNAKHQDPLKNVSAGVEKCQKCKKGDF
ncbi:hypothetical protein [Alkalinema sp. FACHB-956]|uniref:hypothetical protein n=1 Tax=Alkalinema sp. FACHB-956 TaxID=2692768 RepID=UPI00168738D8|nr:hypothetical protein [Alkalinema sp. FACHB-956]MBD2326165.1 hypothetical protein [Alkalinema sp. FACHB-956]